MTEIMHGRRSGQDRSSAVKSAPARFMDHQVAILHPNDWQRIQNNLTRANPQREAAERRLRERRTLHDCSKEVVKNWDNTIEGQRQIKLKAKAIRDEQDEQQRQIVDLEEAKLQAEMRKERIIDAKRKLYNETDRVKQFHGALLLTEVLKERDAQVDQKKSKGDWQKERAKKLVERQKREYQEAVKEDLEKACERKSAAQATSEVLKQQMNERTESAEQDKEVDREEGKVIKSQYRVFEAAQQTIQAERRTEKINLMDTYVSEIDKKEEVEKEVIDKDEAKNKERRKFVNAKRKMAKLRKEKEQELFENFQYRQENMCKKLDNLKMQEVDDEDDRIEKAVQEREEKRKKEQEGKELEYNKTQQQIHKHRMEAMEDAHTEKEKELAEDTALRIMRVDEDNKYQSQMETETNLRRAERVKLQKDHENQVTRKKGGMKEKQERDLVFDKQNMEKLVEEEQHFQEYAADVINDAKKSGRNPYPLAEAARQGPGGGRGPKAEGNAGLRPSYIVTDATGVQLPHYLRDENTYDKAYFHVGRSGKRIGFGW